METGYAIKRAVDRSTRFFWAASLAQVYPELAALEGDGYVVGTDEPQGAPPRRTYRLTRQGPTALDDWLASERIPDFEQRDEGCRGSSSPTHYHPLMRSSRSGASALRAEDIDRTFQLEILPLAQRVPGRFRLIAAREGADYFAWRAEWFRRLESELVADLDAQDAEVP